MNAIDFCIRDVMNSDIPSMIIEDAFLGSRSRYRREPDSVEAKIREEIFRKRIIPDLSAIGGMQVTISLADMQYEKLPNYERIYRIPPNKTNGRRIVQARFTMLNLTSNYALAVPNQQSMMYHKSVIENSAQRVVANNSPIPNRSNAEIEILGDNVLKICDWQNFSSDMNLVCLLEFSSNLSEIRPAYYTDISKLCNLATKAYIYRELALMIDKTRLEGGRDFGRYREFVDEYRDSFNMYKEFIDSNIAKALVLNDQGRKQYHIQHTGKLMF